jgi:sortase A
MRKMNNWMVMVGLLLIVGGAVGVWVNIRNNLPSPFDVVDAPRQDHGFLPIVAPASSNNDSPAGESATPAVAPTVSVGENQGLQSSSQDQVVGMVPDRLVIPAIGVDAPIVPVHYKDIQVGDQVYHQWMVPIEFAAGWQDTSALLGVPGNTVLNGHHNAYGKVFKDLVQLKEGDIVIVYSGTHKISYQVAAKMLLPERFRPLEIRMENAHWIEPSTDERLTLVSCWPADSNTHRVVIVAFPLGSFNQDSTVQPPNPK